MGEDRDEPLEGDIGPAAAPASRPEPSAGTASDTASPDAAEELRRYEAEREERRRRTNAVSGRIAAVLAALILAFLVYDSVTTAVEAHGRGDDWIYPPAVIATLCAIALVTLVAWAVRRVK
ncbi:hypothetical protein E1264_13290 [Actinomadura sp. KC216]|uniref:hypothetical protein n=1 Tax=Actinomadura sp. KC216 TaxID=2530370 RepID=UPI00104593F4|nr:hypothetical protein [Actinomadura sp. KC216]TDB87855.1 hypothetical protein E1264_13290 [Actinomadura sp. KC216]